MGGPWPVIRNPVCVSVCKDLIDSARQPLRLHSAPRARHQMRMEVEEEGANPLEAKKPTILPPSPLLFNLSSNTACAPTFLPTKSSWKGDNAEALRRRRSGNGVCDDNGDELTPIACAPLARDFAGIVVGCDCRSSRPKAWCKLVVRCGEAFVFKAMATPRIASPCSAWHGIVLPCSELRDIQFWTVELFTEFHCMILNFETSLTVWINKIYWRGLGVRGQTQSYCYDAVRYPCDATYFLQMT